VATQTVSAFDALFKNVYAPLLERLLTNETYMLDKVEKQEADEFGTWNGQGRQVIWSAHTGRNRPSGFGLTDGGTLATAGKQSYINLSQTILGFNAAIELTDQVIRQSRGGSTTAFANALTEEMEGATRDMRQRMNRMVYGDGTGLLASCVDTRSARTISVDTGQNIQVGDTVDVLTRSDGTVRQQRCVVTGLTFTGTADGSSQANADVTLDTSVSVTNTEGIYLAGSRVLETEGLTSITGVSRRLHGFDSSTNSLWDGNVLQAGWANISEDLLMQQAQRIRIRTGRDVTSFVGTYGQQRRLANQYQNARRWTDSNGLTIEGGYQSVMVSAGGKQVAYVADRDCPNGRTFSLNMDPLKWVQYGGGPTWLEAPMGGGGILHLKDGSTAGTKVATWQAWIVWYAALCCKRPSELGRIDQFKDDVPIAHV